MIDRIPASADEIAACLRDARRLLLSLVDDLDDDQLVVPRLEIVNPPLWEIGHVAWFQQRWTLRELGGEAPLLDGEDELFDSSEVAHDTRWQIALPDRAATARYVEDVLDRVLDRLERVEPTARERYFHRLALLHEDMHCEALVYARQTLAYPAPRGLAGPRAVAADAGDAEFAGGTLELGARDTGEFVFDNEQEAHPVEVAPFRIARAPVTQREFAAFVDDGGYRRQDLWSRAGWRWRAEVRAEHPVYWLRDPDGKWYRRAFDTWLPLEDDLPVSFVSWYEADAFCRWAGRRLPTEAEHEQVARAADARGCRGLTGHVWEWTASTFAPYPGFVPGPYRDYSEPWFGTRKVLRGGSWATRRRMLRPTLRNFFTPDRRDIPAGLRSAAPRDR